RAVLRAGAEHASTCDCGSAGPAEGTGMNHGGGGRPGKGGRQVTEDEAELWRQLTDSVDKVKAKPRVATHHAPPCDVADLPLSLPRGEGKAGQRRQPAPQRLSPAVSPAPPRAAVPLPAELDRRTLRQVAAGKVAIGDVLDLHGLHQDAAHARLRAFLMSSQAK